MVSKHNYQNCLLGQLNAYWLEMIRLSFLAIITYCGNPNDNLNSLFVSVGCFVLLELPLASWWNNGANFVSR